MKPKTLIAASCAACLLVLLTPAVVSRDEPWAAGRPAPGTRDPGSRPRPRPDLQVDPVAPDGAGRLALESQLAPMQGLEGREP